MRYSRTSQPNDDASRIYIASTAVFMAELIKICTCFFMLNKTKPLQKTLKQVIDTEIIAKPQEILKMLIPSGLYALQNNLLYIALSNLEAATFQVTYQLKILSTAAFSVALLGRSLNRDKWLALVLLMLGVTLVQMESVTTASKVVEDAGGIIGQRPIVGLLAVLTSCVSSGFAGCYFEKILKTSTTSMWVRNIQLGLCGACFSLLGMLMSDFSLIRENGIFQGYNALTWFVVLNQALGGLLVSVVVKYADNILKGFATSISIILSGVISFFFLDFLPSYLFIIGTGIVIAATFLYGAAATK